MVTQTRLHDDSGLTACSLQWFQAATGEYDLFIAASDRFIHDGPHAWGCETPSAHMQAIAALVLVPALLVLLGAIERRSFVRSERRRLGGRAAKRSSGAASLPAGVAPVCDVGPAGVPEACTLARSPAQPAC